MSKLTVPCSYCMLLVAIKLGDVATRFRECALISFTCPHCDSTTELYMGSRRKRRGKKRKAHDERRAAILRAQIALSVTFADYVAPELLKQYGCSCAERARLMRVSNSYSNYYGDQRPDGLCDVIDGRGIKLPPRHHGTCSLSGSEYESELRATFSNELHVQLGEKENA